jgi:predicted N-acetyltransferase YhbS
MNANAFPSKGFTVTPSSDLTPHLVAAGDKGSAAASAPYAIGRIAHGSRDASGEGVAVDFLIHPETDADVPAREALLDRAMGPGRRRKSSEKLRRGRLPSAGLAFAARDADGAVVGTVRLWDVAFDLSGGVPPPHTPPHKGEGGVDAGVHQSVVAGIGMSEFPSPLWGGVRGGGDRRGRALLLGPLAVDPSIKSAGIGSALMRHAISEARRLGHGAILLVGDAPYYARFGFTADKTGNLAMPGPYERHRFLALELVEGALDGAAGVLSAAGRKLRSEQDVVAA